MWVLLVVKAAVLFALAIGIAKASMTMVLVTVLVSCAIEFLEGCVWIAVGERGMGSMDDRRKRI